MDQGSEHFREAQGLTRLSSSSTGILHPQPTAQRSRIKSHSSNHTQTLGSNTARHTGSALPTSPAASRICTTSVLPNKAASCKALPISVWKANKSAAARQRTVGVSRDKRDTDKEGWQSSYTGPSGASAFQHFLYGF